MFAYRKPLGYKPRAVILPPHRGRWPQAGGVVCRDVGCGMWDVGMTQLEAR